MICTVCMKPNAVRYYIPSKNKDGSTTRSLVYEHRDEPPIKTYEYEGKGKIHSYRRCFAGPVSDESIMPELGDEEEQQSHQPIHKITPSSPEKQEIANGKDYKKMYLDEKRRHDALRKMIKGWAEYV